MKLNIKNTWLIYMVTFVLALFITFIAIQFVVPGAHINAEDGGFNKKVACQVVSTAEEASKIAGFPAATVSNVPDDLKKPDLYAVYEVKKGVWEIAQQWGTPGKGPVMGLIQTIHGSLAGENLTTFTYKIITGVRHFVPETDRNPGRIDMFWKNGDVGYYLFANLTGSLDENTVMEIANSVAVK
jgi:hypothetical protein